MTPTRRFQLALFALCGGVALWQPSTSAQEDAAALSRATRQEQTLVKAVHTARDEYQASMERLRAYYVRSKNVEMQYWVEQELSQYHMMVKDPYILEYDLPSKDLKPNQNIAEAKKILADARAFLEKPSLTDTARNYHRAELLLRRLINDYRQSDKLDDACFYLGDIYTSKYFEQYRRGVAFYERVFWYDPATNYPARLKAAIVYEKQLNDHERAKQLFQDVLQRQTDPGQTREARRHLDKLLGSKQPKR